MKTTLLVSTMFTAAFSNAAFAQSWENSGSPATIVELFTSEGCSSCPPAEAALNQLTEQQGLWTEVIPLAFHVDYWNYIGWPDRFSKPAYTERQRQKVAQAGASGVYTPGWFINDQEWRGFFSRQSIPYTMGPKAAQLTASLDDNRLAVRYDSATPLKAHYALLAMDQQTKVKRGENRGRTLDHQFVVVDFGDKIGRGTWQFSIPQKLEIAPKAIAVWLTPPEGGDPVQTVAGWLEPHQAK